MGTGTIPIASWVTSAAVPYTYQGSSHIGILGNYWSTYSGTDANGDGIGDTSYNTGVSNQIDSAPLMDQAQFYFGASHSATASVSVIPASATVNVSETKQFAGKATDSDGLNIPGLNYTWSSSNETVGTISQSGLFTALTPGSANITASNGGISNTSVVTVLSALSQPVADFTANVTNGTAPLSVQFTDASTGSPTGWSWDFGDGNTSTTQNPAYTYATAGNYTVNLTATNAGGSNTTVKMNYITVTESETPMAPVAGFTANVTNGTAPLAVGFTDQSTGTPTSWSWNFGDGNTSIEQSPAHTYATAGNYTVNLTATNAGGNNTTTKTNYITVTTAVTPVPVANFSANITNGTAPLAVQFNDTSLGENLTAWSWAFGDGNTSLEQNPIYNYTTAGSYTVNLTVTNATGSDNEVKTSYITVSAPVIPTPTITVAPLSAIRHIFINTANGVKYNYDGATYGGPNNTYYVKADGGGLNELHLTNDANVASGQVTTTGAQNGTFYVTNTGGRGFDDDIILLVSVKGPIPDNFGIHLTSNGYVWTPAAAGAYNPTAPTDSSYVTGIDQTFSKADFIYGPQTWKPGPHQGSADLVTPYLPLYTGQDINDASTAQYLMFVDLKAGNVKQGVIPSATLNNGALKVDYSITNLSTRADFNGFAWANASNQGQGITWTNNVFNPGASGYSVTAPVAAPVAGFNASVTNGTAPLAVQFNDLSTGTPTSWSWDFGDGNTSTTQSPSHTYTVAGNYTVNLTATNAGGSNTTTKTNYITVTASESPSAPVANFNANVTNGTAPLTVGFTDASTGAPTSWSWSFGDGNTSTTQSPSHTYTVAGNYTVNLTATNASGSNTSVRTNYITVTGSETPTAPVANFNANITNGTAPLAVQFTDLSTGAPVTWSWDFGDGNTSTVQNPAYTYAAAGNYTVNLTATNAGGSNTTTKTNYITIHAVVPPTTAPTTTAPTTVPTTIPTTIATTIPTTVPTKIPTTVPTTIPVTPTPTMQPVTANFTANVTAGQTPLSVQFTDLSTGTIRQYFWQFGDGGASFDKNPVHTYSAAGTYTVSLVAIGSTGAEVKTIPQYITVTGPGTPTVSPTVTTTVTTTTPAPTTTTTITPTVTTTIPVTTTVTPLPTSSGHDLPIANFVVTYQAGAGSMGIQVTDATTNATTVKYDLGDGTTTAYKNFKYTYWQPGTYTITLIATNDAGSSTKTVTVTVPAGSPTTMTVTPTPTATVSPTITPTQTPTNPNLPVANFTITFQGGSGSMGIQVTNTAVNATSVHYNLGDGTTTAYPNFTYTYWQPGNYTINQTATNAAGSTTRTINVTVPAVATPTTIPTTTVSPTVTGTVPAYNGTHTIPGQLQAEDYDLGGEGIAYHDTTAGNEGGVYRHDDVDIEQIDTDRSPSVGWTRAGEWLAYTVNINTAGTYTAGFRVASAHAGSSVQVYLDDGTTPIATVNVPNTGNDATFQTLQVPVTLPAGQHRLKLAFPGNYANINWINFA
ncbi:PKD domain-containing protein [Methanosphaerula palustris]|uniref:PKD domain-containing protein n=1 Tax=Methanosphaerula palustris TaxID=475088 RepID=UPI001F374C66|nr:PKD domain-containing protein [Methanosphaerula palustris]